MTSSKRREIIERDIQLVQLKYMSVEEFKAKHGFLKTSICFAKSKKKEDYNG